MAEPRDYDPDSPCLPSPRATTPHEVALMLRVSTAAARGRLEVARGLVEHFPLTLTAATDGTLPWWQARHAVEQTVDLSPAARVAVDHELADHARRGRSPARFSTRLRGAILDADPAAAEQTHRHSLADRAVWVDPHPNGTVTVAATLAAEGGGVFLEMADRLADTALSVPPAGWPVEGRTPISAAPTESTASPTLSSPDSTPPAPSAPCRSTPATRSPTTALRRRR